jgi:Fe-S-cluster containining protein
MKELLVAHGLMDPEDDSGQVALTIWHECDQLQWDGRIAGCAIYEDRPEICREFKCHRMTGKPNTQLRAEIKT